MKIRLITIIASLLLGSGIFTGPWADECHADPRCVENSGHTKHVCVEWSKGYDPVAGTHFEVDYECTGCSDAPDVELTFGDDEWIVYSEVISTQVAANIGAMTTIDNENYGVKIAKGAGAGAGNVACMVLTPSGDHSSSILTGSIISGNLAGDLTLQETSGGSGGALALTIGANVEGDITIPNVSLFTVGGDVGSDVTITVGSLVGDKQLLIGSSGKEFSGTLLFPNGLSDYGTVTISSLLKDGASVDFNGQEMDCYLTFAGGAESGSELNTGVFDGTLNVSNIFEGTANFSSMEGGIEMEGTDLAGTINVLGEWDGYLVLLVSDFAATGIINIGGDLTATAQIDVVYIQGLGGGDWDGVLDVDGSILSGASVDIDGDMAATGAIQVDGDIAGDVTVDSNMAGDIEADDISGSLSIGGNAYGRVTLMGFTGSVDVTGDVDFFWFIVAGDGSGDITGGAVTSALGVLAYDEVNAGVSVSYIRRRRFAPQPRVAAKRLPWEREYWFSSSTPSGSRPADAEIQ